MTDLAPNDLRLISLVFWGVVIALLLIGVALTQPKRNRYTRKRWPREGQTHSSYWSGCKRVEE